MSELDLHGNFTPIPGKTGSCIQARLTIEGALYKEVFPGKTEADLSVTVDVRRLNSKWRAISELKCLCCLYLP